jgi:hypothetical protein
MVAVSRYFPGGRSEGRDTLNGLPGTSPVEKTGSDLGLK